MQIPPPPQLLTLDRTPSWVNKARRVDRSACAELRASDIRRYVEFRRIIAKRDRHLPDRPARCIGRGEVTIVARVFDQVMRRRKPLALAGDFRTSKANAMKPDFGRRPVPPPSELILRNPNRGATRTKWLGLTEEWKQTFRVERWRQHERLTQTFLICPFCDRKVMKLFLPQCTLHEAEDAHLAQTWLATYGRRITVHHTLADLRDRMLDRYELFFQPRHLRCRHCLGLRYGETTTGDRRAYGP